MQPTILVVEDDGQTREALRGILERQGYAVDVVPDGEQAIGALAGQRYDVIILDVALPKMSGTDVMEYLAGTTPDILASIVVVTGLDAVEIRNLFPQICDTLSKPVLPARLMESIRRCLGEPPPAAGSTESVA